MALWSNGAYTLVNRSRIGQGSEDLLLGRQVKAAGCPWIRGVTGHVDSLNKKSSRRPEQNPTWAASGLLLQMAVLYKNLE